MKITWKQLKELIEIYGKNDLKKTLKSISKKLNLSLDEGLGLVECYRIYGLLEGISENKIDEKSLEKIYSLEKDSLENVDTNKIIGRVGSISREKRTQYCIYIEDEEIHDLRLLHLDTERHLKKKEYLPAFIIGWIIIESALKHIWHKFIDDLSRYLFSWDDVPKKDSRQFIDFLENNLKIDWVKNAKIKKSDNGKTITVTNKENSLKFKLEEDKSKVVLEIDGGGTYEYILKKENDKRNIYKGIKFKTGAKKFGIAQIIEGLYINNFDDNLVSQNRAGKRLKQLYLHNFDDNEYEFLKDLKYKRDKTIHHGRKCLFKLKPKPNYKQYLKTGGVDEQLRKKFERNNVSLPSSAMILQINEKTWEIKASAGSYIINDVGERINVYIRRIITEEDAKRCLQKAKELIDRLERIKSTEIDEEERKALKEAQDAYWASELDAMMEQLMEREEKAREYDKKNLHDYYKKRILAEIKDIKKRNSSIPWVHGLIINEIEDIAEGAGEYEGQRDVRTRILKDVIIELSKSECSEDIKSILNDLKDYENKFVRDFVRDIIIQKNPLVIKSKNAHNNRRLRMD